MITAEKVEQRAIELGTEFGCKVKPVMFTDENGEKIVAYIKHPDFNQLCYVFDKMATGNATDGAAAIFDLGLIKEESNERFYSKKDEDIRVRFSGVITCMDFVQIFQNEMKKK